ncbi:hypothetical protein JRO89_XS13G0182600 [Xanthoceras sorbifolium]|uniref:BHLH domain-containing protein n=1 Tax=Xanthoceras sorbifolium TaxID=99658 RepID=A0ABQ8H8Z8_9ROSI|nr:hypothetical protein JRO89_XS13G0182600 [Xanthoceras sorbifolium]
MDPPLVNESSFTAANPSSYSLAEIWPYPINGGGGGSEVGLRMGNIGLGFGEISGHRDGSAEESTVTEQSGGGCGRKRRDLSSEDESSKIVSTTSSANDLVGYYLFSAFKCLIFCLVDKKMVEQESILRDMFSVDLDLRLLQHDLNGKRMKVSDVQNENGGAKAEVEASSAAGGKPAEQSSKPEPPKDYIHVRARRGQATDSHSLAERARREKISERMKILQDLVPGCNKVIGKALVLDEIINYIQSLQRQVEFLSMKLEAVNSTMSINPTIEPFHSKDLGAQPFDAAMIFGPQAAREFAQGSQSEWLHMQIGGSLDRAT